MHNETFGQALRRLRGSRSVRDVAQLASCGKTHVSDLETGKRRPTDEIAAALDQALGARGELIALAQHRPGATVLQQVDVLHRGLTESLAAGPMTDAGLDEWEYTVSRHGRATRYRPERELLRELVADFQDLRLVLSHRHPPTTHKKLTVTAARLSGLMALTLLKLGDGRATAWWRTGRAAAAAADDRATLSWIYAQEAYQLYYGGDVYGAVDLAARAQHLAGGLPCVGPALAAPPKRGPTLSSARASRVRKRSKPRRPPCTGFPRPTGSVRRSATASPSFAFTPGTPGPTSATPAVRPRSTNAPWSCIRLPTVRTSRSSISIRRCARPWTATRRALRSAPLRPSSNCQISTAPH